MKRHGSWEGCQHRRLLARLLVALSPCRSAFGFGFGCGRRLWIPRRRRPRLVLGLNLRLHLHLNPICISFRRFSSQLMLRAGSRSFMDCA